VNATRLKRMRKFLRNLLVLFCVFLLLFFAFFVYHRAHHDCAEDSCPICVMLSGSGLNVACILCAVFLIADCDGQKGLFSTHPMPLTKHIVTLVQLKVKLSN